MSAKKYVLCTAAVLFTFIIINLALWHGYIKQMFSQRDLNRLGFFIGSEDAAPQKEYKAHHTEMKEYMQEGMKASFDIITIGDSFTNGGGGGYYQDYLADRYGISSLNFNGRNSCLEDLYMLAFSGILDKAGPKAVILEKVARGVNDELGRKRILPVYAGMKDIESLVFRKKTNIGRLSSGILPPVLSDAGISFLYSMFLRKINPERLSPEVYTAELDRNLFDNAGNGNRLLFYYYDLHYLNSEHPVNADMINENLNAAAGMLREKGIKLLFMPCADKYDLYYPYITDKKGRPENTLFQAIRAVPGKEYEFIDTKAILQEALARGEKDLYWHGDTHWGYKGFELVCDEIAKYLQP